MSDELKRICTGSAYLYTPDGAGGVMVDHYHASAGPVTNEPEPGAVVKFKDDFSSGIHPGFNMPLPRTVCTKMHTKTTIKNPTMAIGSWNANDYYTKGIFPPKKVGFEDVPEVDNTQKEEEEWEWINPTENVERCDSVVVSGVSDQTVGRFTDKEWEDMAQLVD